MNTQFKLVLDWFDRKMVVLGGKQCVFPHGAEHIEKIIQELNKEYVKAIKYLHCE